MDKYISVPLCTMFPGILLSSTLIFIGNTAIGLF